MRSLPDHHNTAWSLRQVGKMYYKTGDSQRSRDYYRKAMRFYGQHYHSHPWRCTKIRRNINRIRFKKNIVFSMNSHTYFRKQGRKLKLLILSF
jgi:hypothetical protein